MTGALGPSFLKLYFKWRTEIDTPESIGAPQDEQDLYVLQTNVDLREYLPGEGDGFACGRAGYLRALLWLLNVARYPSSKQRLVEMIRDCAGEIGGDLLEVLGNFCTLCPSGRVRLDRAFDGEVTGGKGSSVVGVPVTRVSRAEN